MSGEVTIEVNGSEVPARLGDTLAAVLVREGHRVFRLTEQGAPRGLFCGMGICWDCLVTVEGDVVPVRACITEARDGMRLSIPSSELLEGPQ